MTHTPKKTASERRKAALAKVESYVCNDRQNTYGDAEDEFPRVAAMMNLLLKQKLSEPLDAFDVCLLHIAVKACRASANRNHADSWHDLAGYAACASGILEGQTEQKEGKL